MDEQEIMVAQERLLKKREELGVTTNPTRLTTSVDEFMEMVPNCRHGEKVGFCQQCFEEKEDNYYKANGKNMSLDDKYHDIVDCKELRVEKWMREAYGIPKKYLQASFDNFQGNEKAIEICKESIEGGDIVLSGPTGCGKTHLATSVLRELAIRRIKHLREPGQAPCDRSPINATFITVPKLLLNLRSSFNGNGKLSRNGWDGSASEDEIIEHYSACAFLILDDLGAEKTTDFSMSCLYIIIDNRINELKRTIITTNLTLKELEEKMDARIASRLAGMKVISISMSDYRKKRNYAKQLGSLV